MARPASHFSAGSEDSTSASPVLGFDISSSVRAILGAATCCEHGSPESPSTTTYTPSVLKLSRTEANGSNVTEDHAPTLDGACGRLAVLLMPTGSRIHEGIAPTLQAANSPSRGGTDGPLILLPGEALAKTSASPGTEPGSTATDPACSSSTPGSLTLFDPDGFSGRTFLVPSLARAVGTSEQSLERWPTSGTAWAGGFSTAVTSECRSDEEGCSSSEPSLTEILEPPQNVPAKYSLSARAARGILKRAKKRGKRLPEHLEAALVSVAGLRTPNA